MMSYIVDEFLSFNLPTQKTQKLTELKNSKTYQTQNSPKTIVSTAENRNEFRLKTIFLVIIKFNFN